MTVATIVANGELTNAAINRSVHYSAIGSIRHESAKFARLDRQAVDATAARDDRLVPIDNLVTVWISKYDPALIPGYRGTTLAVIARANCYPRICRHSSAARYVHGRNKVVHSTSLPRIAGEHVQRGNRH